MAGSQAGIAQLVERNLAKVEVASSSLVSRSRFRQSPVSGALFCRTPLLAVSARIQSTGLVAEWLCSGLQIRVRRFNSDPGLHLHFDAR